MIRTLDSLREILEMVKTPSHAVLPKTEHLKLTFTCPASLKPDLERYAALHSQICGEEVDALTLIPHMLEAFMARDRVFRRLGTRS